MPINIAGLRADPEFAQMDYTAQRDTMRRVLLRNIQEDAQAQSLSTMEQQEIAERASASYVPVLKAAKSAELSDADRARFGQSLAPTTDPNDETKYVLWLAERARSGDAKAYQAGTNWYLGKRLVNETLVGKALMAGKDAFEFIAQGDRDWDLGFDRDTTEKLGRYVLAQQPGGEQTASLVNVAAGASGFAELVALNMVFVGSLAAPGLVTKGLFASAKAGALKAAPGLAYGASKAFASYGVEALGSAGVDVLRSLPELIAQGQLQGAKGFWKGTSETFGEGIAYDVLFNVMQDVVRAGLLPLGKIFFGKRFDLASPETIQQLQKAVNANSDPEQLKTLMSAVVDNRFTKDMLGQLDPDFADSLVATAGNLRRLEAMKIDKWDSDEFLTLYGKATGYDVEPLKQGYLIKRSGNTITSSASRPDAFSWLGANAKTTIDMDDLARGYRGQTGSSVVAKIQGRLDPNKLSDDTLLGMSVALRDGKTDTKTVQVAMQNLIRRTDSTVPKATIDGIKVSRVSEQSFRKRVTNVPAMLSGHPNTLLVPDTMADPTTREAFLGYMTEFGRTKAPGFRNVEIEYAERSAVSPQGLSAAASRLPEGTMLQEGQAWRLAYRSADGSLVQRTVQSNEEGARVLGEALTREGLLSEPEIHDAVLKDSGVFVGPETGEFGSVYVARDIKGGEIARSESLVGVFEQRPELWPRLPERLGPDLYYLGGGNRFEMQRTIATGPYSDLQRVMNSFGRSEVPAQWRTIEMNADKKVRIRSSKNDPARAQYAVQIDGLGFQTKFGSLKKAQEFVDAEIGGWNGVRKIANTRGYDMQTGPSNEILIRAVDGQGTFIAKNLDEASEFLRKAPVAESHKNLIMALDDELDEVLVRSAQGALENDTTAFARTAISSLEAQLTALDSTTIASTLNNLVSPAYSQLERLGKKYGMPDIPVLARQLSARTRTMAAQTLNSTRVIRAITSPGGKLIDQNTSEVLGRILSEGPQGWDAAAKKLGFELKPEHTTVLNATKLYYERLGSVFGIDAWRYLSDYAPKLRAAVENYRASGEFEKMTMHQLMSRQFGSNWRNVPELKFFAQHTRLDNFLDATRNRMGIVDQMVHYTEEGYSEQYLGGFQQQLADWYKKLSKVPMQSSDRERIVSFYETALGGAKGDYLARDIAETSIALSTKLSEGVKALKGVFPKAFAKQIDKLAENIVTTDIPGKLSAMVTHATLGFRPFRAISNLFQYMNTFSVFGHDAISDIVDLTDKRVQQMFRQGIIQEKVFASSAKGIGESNKLLEFGLKPQQQSEYLTRAWTAEAAEKSFNRAFERLSGGALNWDQFVKESKLSLLDQSGIDKVLELVKAGNPEAGRTLFQTESVRILMFDYAKENYPLAFKGVVGKAFGKFGIFPVGQVDLYRRILGTGDASDRIMRTIRVVGSSLVVYNAFRQVGIDYSGFLWNDAFSFSGGPMFQAGQDLMKIGSSGPEGSMARRDLARSFLPGIDSDGNLTVPRLVVPGALEINALIKAGRLLSDDPYKAALTAMGATTSKDWLRGGLKIW